MVGARWKWPCLYFETDAEEMLESYNSEAGAVRMALALDGAFLAGDEALAPAVERFLGPEGVPGGGMDWGIATQVRNTGLTVVSLVDNRKLMAGYERTLWLCAGAVAAMLGSYALFSVLFLRRIVLPVQHLNEGMEHLQQGDFTHKLPPEGHLEMRQLLQRYNDTGDRMQALIEENRLREEQRYAEELKALQSEINPHFLLNTVNTIRFMADLARFDSIRDMAADLMEILRCMLRTPQSVIRWRTRRKYWKRISISWRCGIPAASASGALSAPRAWRAVCPSYCCSLWWKTPCSTAWRAARTARSACPGARRTAFCT